MINAILFTLFILVLSLVLLALIPLLFNQEVAYDLWFVPVILWSFIMIIIISDRNAYIIMDDNKISRKSFAGMLEVSWTDITGIIYSKRHEQINLIVAKNRKVWINNTLLNYSEIRGLVLQHIIESNKTHLLPEIMKTSYSHKD